MSDLRQRLAQQVLLLTLAGTSLLGCTPARHSRMMQISETSASHPTEIAPGDRLQITLAENITTGYSWQLEMTSCTGSLRLDTDQADRPGGPPGAGGHHIWTFTALHPAQCELHFRSVRPWEKAATGNSLVFPVTISNGP